ncbi:MAG: transposase, partial [bacterium]
MATRRMTDSNTAEVPGQGFLLDDPEVLKEVVRRWLQELLESELRDYLGAGRYERAGSRRGYRSGHRPRRLQTRLGKLALSVPTERSGGYRTRLFARYQRSEQAFL